MILLTFLVMAGLLLVANGQFNCYTTARDYRYLQDCGKDCLYTPQVQDTLSKIENVLFSSCLKYKNEAAALGATVDGDTAGNLFLSGYDGLGTYLPCSSLISNGGVTKQASELAERHFFNLGFGYGWGGVVDGPTFTEFECFETDNGNSGLKVQIVGNGVDRLKTSSSMVVFKSFFLIAVAVLSVLLLQSLY